MWRTFLVIIFNLSALCYSEGQVLNTVQIDSIFRDWNRSDEPGGAVGIIRNGKLLYSKGFGMADLEHGVTNTPNTVFYLASVSKQFTAFCILLLEEQGKLSLDDTIQKYLPDFPVYDRPIAISHLIHHTSGLRDYSTLIDLQGRSYLEDISEREVYELIKRQKSLNFSPGDEYMYSNSGYFLLAKIVEMVSHQTLREFAAENIFKPLGMSSTTFLDDNRMLIKNRAFSYEKNKGGESFNNIIRRFDLVGSGGVYSTIEDLARWDHNFDDNTLGKGGQSIITRMFEEDTLTNGTPSGYAVGLEKKTYRDAKRVSHSGSNAGYRTFFIRFPEHRLTVVLLSNRRDGDLGKVFKVADVILGDQLISIPPPVSGQSTTKKDKPDFALNENEMKKLTGVYFNEELNSFYSIVIRDHRLQLSVNNSDFLPLQVNDATSVNSETFGDFLFVKRNQKVKGFNLSIPRVKKIYFEKVK